jgi:hypothetical protein
LSAEFSVDEFGHLMVEGRESLVRGINEMNLHASPVELLSHLYADVAAAYHHRGLRLGPIDEIVNGSGVFHVAEGEHTFVVEAWHRWTNRLGAHRQNQLVIGNLKHFARPVIHASNYLVGSVDLLHVVPNSDVEPETFGQGLRGLQNEVIVFGDFAPKVVGQAAIRKRNVTGSFQNHNSRPFV